MKNDIIEIRIEDKTKKLFRNGQLAGQYAKTANGYEWQNVLANTVNNAYTQGVAPTERQALLQLGFKIVN